MKNMDWLITNYTAFLGERQENLRSNIEKLYIEERKDEAVLEKIKLNVVEIFSKMFAISCKEKPTEIRAKYFMFFDRITASWYENRDNAFNFGAEKEGIIEDLKIAEVEDLKARFEELFLQLDAE